MYRIVPHAVLVFWIAFLFNGCGRPVNVDGVSSCVGNLSRLGKSTILFITDYGASTNLDSMVAIRYVHLADTWCPGSTVSSSKPIVYNYVIGLRDGDPEECVVAYCSPSNHSVGKGCVLYLNGSVDVLAKADFDALIYHNEKFWGTSNHAIISELKTRARIVSSKQEEL